MFSPIYRLGFHLTDRIITYIIFFFTLRLDAPLYSTVYYIYAMFKFILYHHHILYAQSI
jgi:hypothetical protein